MESNPSAPLLQNGEQGGGGQNQSLTGANSGHLGGGRQGDAAWDVFRITPHDDLDQTLSSKWMEVTLKAMKALAYLITFAVVLSTSLISKSIILLMTSMTKVNRTLSVCNAGLERDKRYFTKLEVDDPQRIVWIWCLFFVMLFPEILALFRSARICTFKMYKRPEKLVFMTMLTFESLHTIGVCLLVFVVLPELDVVKGAMLTNCLCLVPALFGLMSRNESEGKRAIKYFLDVLSILAQASSYIVWIWSAGPEMRQSGATWIIPIACFLVGFGWIENYVDPNSPVGFVRALGKMRKKLHRSRYFAWIFISIWKLLLMFGMMISCRYFMDGSVRNIFTQFRSSFLEHKITLYVDRTPLHTLNLPSEYAHLTPTADKDLLGIEEGTDVIWSSVSSPIWLVFVQIAATWLCYVFGKFACKICIQGFSYAFPLSLTVPVTISVLIAACGIHLDRKCQIAQYLPRYLFFNCQDDPFESNSALFSAPALMWLFWLMSQIWIAIHIWLPQCERLATTEKLFVSPMYSSVIIDQSLAFNRRRDDKEKIKSDELNLDHTGDGMTTTADASQHYETISEHLDDKKPGSTIQSSDHVTRILACVTMWHETREEMMQLLKSIFRMDEDQSARRNAQKYLRIVDPDYYEFEVHIYFDDAFEISDINDDWSVVNRFVLEFVEVIDEAASHVHETNIQIKPPRKYPTPYGGRLEWTLPGGTKLTVHMKDKLKIRHKKRWSQVMYMYYLLGHRLMELPIDVKRKAVIAENTYLLTLDGDINFRPHAVRLLVDLMKKNRNLGAACGRIHPVGSGPMVWYQKFEYAIGHWLQKATEHMIGCVLCAPGCFSLFRAKALMDDNVMCRYTHKSGEAVHYVQYDQGEDRWLCTLLLQRGYRVEYSAASDAYTHCPEGFGEFYTQRRRWAPSTMANIMDLLGTYKQTIAINDSISLPYMIYQSMLMIGTILGPGTIFLMLVGAMVAALRISNYYSFYYNLIPILAFIIICFSCKNDIQILVAQMLSSAYALLMTAVFVGIGIQMTEDSVLSPTAIFFIALMSSFFIAAALHPQEFGCIFPFPLYMLSIPCMYLLLTIYSLINLNVVSWGTREIQSKKTKKELEQERKEAEELKKKDILGYFRTTQDEEEGSIVFNLANLFKCMFCTYPKASEEKIHLIKIEEHMGTLTKKLSSLERAIDHVVPPGMRSRKTSNGRRGTFSDNLSTVTENDDDPAAADHPERPVDFDDSDMSDSADRDRDSQSSGALLEKRDDLLNPLWVEDDKLQEGDVAYLHPQEIQFWKELINKYLKPLDSNKEHETRVANELKELRNRVVFFFFMLNSLYVLIVFLLQLNKNILYVEWPWGARRNITFDPERNEAIVDEEPLHLEPIGLVFVVFFGLILIIQFFGMSFHRFATLSHILASVELSCCSNKVDDISTEAFLDKNAIQIVRQLQRLKGLDETEQGSDSSNYGPNRIDRRKTIEILEKRKQQRQKIGTLDVAFKKRFMEISTQNIEGTPVLGGKRSRDTVYALEKRRNAAIGDDGRMQTLGQNNEFTRGQGKNKSTLDGAAPRRRGAIPFNTAAAAREQQLQQAQAGQYNRGYIRGSSDEDEEHEIGISNGGGGNVVNAPPRMRNAVRDMAAAGPPKRMSTIDRNQKRNSTAAAADGLPMNFLGGNPTSSSQAGGPNNGGAVYRQNYSTSSSSVYGPQVPNGKQSSNM